MSKIRRVKGVRRIGVRMGNWLTAEQSKRLLAGADRESLRGKRNYAMLAMLIGCGLRRGELLASRVHSIQLREEHWVIADLLGKAGQSRTVPIPAWVKAAIDEWKNAAGITDGALFRSINNTGRVWGTGMTPKVLWEIVREAASRAGIEKFVPHDLNAQLREALSPGRRRTRSNSVPARTHLNPDNRALPGLQTEIARSSQ
jgi:integrase